MTSEEQLERWVAGESVHDEERGQCTPDFSCCKPALLAPADEREAFARADEPGRAKMLGVFLGRAVSAACEAAGKKIDVYVAGSNEERVQ